MFGTDGTNGTAEGFEGVEDIFNLLKSEIIVNIHDDINSKSFASFNKYLNELKKYFSKDESENLLLDFIMQEKLNLTGNKIIN